jgi:hypothetical protein
LWPTFGWYAATLVLMAGTAGLTYILSANYPGDSGPVIGPGAADKIKFSLEVGPLVVIAAAIIVYLSARAAGQSQPGDRARHEPHTSPESSDL